MKVPVFFDAERLKYPNTGLYHFCLQLGKAIAKRIPVTFFSPTDELSPRISIHFWNKNDENDYPIFNISPLSNLLNIVNLSLSHFRILDISCLSNLRELEHLSLKRNKITDINPLINLILENKNLSHINLECNLISDISPLLNIPQDKEMFIELYGNPIDENQYLDLKKTHKYLDIHF